MSYPSLEQYQEALQHPRTALLDAELNAGTISVSGLGLPVVLCGGFALTYTVRTRSGKFAVRCFHRQSPNLEARYAAISARLAQLSSSYFLPFTFQHRGIRIAGSVYPIVKMAWAEGETLGDFVTGNYRNKSAIGALRNSLKSLSDYLGSQQIAHGDLQPGNVMVARGGSSVQLIDYDGMFVPAIQRLGASEIGHRNFQHPKRNNQHFGAALDRFSLICLDVALMALEADPGLWDTTQSDSESFLFRAADYANPGASSIFRSLIRHGSVGAQVKALAAVCAADFSAVPTLTDFRAGRNVPQLRVVEGAPPAQPSRYISQYPVLDATNYQLYERHVGSVVELVGRVTDFKRDRAKRTHNEYVFVNFGNWRGKIVKLTVWSSALPKVGAQITEALVGSWVSVVGLVEPPYVNRKFGYSHISIDITGPGQLRVISAQEAQFRLGVSPARAGAPAAASPPNMAIRPVTKNAAILKQMRQATPAQPPVATPIRPRGASSPQQPAQPGAIRRLLHWLIGGVGALVVLWLLMQGS